jgi:hypothetical protein
MNKEDWQKGLTAYENINKQALIDLEFSELVIERIKKKIEEFETEVKNGE